MDAEVLRGLRDKYGEIRAMRSDLAAGLERAPRARMRALAARFPGALRELDELPSPVVEERIATLDAALAGHGVPSWARAQSAYHGWMRVALELKRRFGRTRSVEEAARWLRDSYRAEPDEPPAAALGPEAVRAILRPPEGRLSAWVLCVIADADGREVREVALEVLPPRR